MSEPTPSTRARQKAQTHAMIVDALIEALAAGALEKATHEALARRVGVTRQTVYRHFPDRESLLHALWRRLNAELSAGGLPADEASLVAGIRPSYLNFDRIADLVTIAQSTAQGRAMRLTAKPQRQATFLQATAAAADGLPTRDKVLVAAVIQLLNGGQAWLEMRQQWDLSGEEIGEACEWATKTLLADLHARKGRPLTQA